ncbi:MAG: glycosyltransferase [Melioribacter sp.]|nr:glycosyltransferase [Melioribacter sp.]
MKILYVITKSDIGGAQVFVLNLARAFQKNGDEVEVVAGDGDFLFSELDKDNIKYYYLNSLKRNFSVFNALYFVFQLRNLLKSKKYDVVHLNSSNTLIGAAASLFLKNKPKNVFTFHGLSFIDKNFNPNFIIKYLAKFYFKIFLKAVDEIIFECQMNYDELAGEGMFKNARIIYNGLNPEELEFLNPDEARQFLSDKCGTDLENNFIIGSTGRLAYQKNYEFLINNFHLIKEKIPDAKVLIIGDGQDYDEYKRMIKERGIEMDFYLLGEIKNSHRFINGFDLFTLTSRYEGVAISLIEAIYSNTPVLVSNVGGNPDVVGGDSNQLFELDNFEEYLEKLLKIRHERKMIIEHNASLRVDFSLSKMVNNYKEVYFATGNSRR